MIQPAAQSRLLTASVRTVQAFRIGNLLIALFFVVLLIASLPVVDVMRDAIVRKYGARVDPDAVVTFIRVSLLIGLPLCLAAERLLTALLAILRSVEHGDPFVPANAARLRMIGWMLLAFQLADLLFGLARLAADALHIDYTTWRPGFAGWLTVLVVFVLAQVFERGTTMRDDLDGTV